jgi:hypothetical protein
MTGSDSLPDPETEFALKPRSVHAHELPRWPYRPSRPLMKPLGGMGPLPVEKNAQNSPIALPASERKQPLIAPLGYFKAGVK